VLDHRSFSVTTQDIYKNGKIMTFLVKTWILAHTCMAEKVSADSAQKRLSWTAENGQSRNLTIFLGAFCGWQFWMWESWIWGRWVGWFIGCGHGTVSHRLQFSADLLQGWRDILWSGFANVSLMFFATYPQIFIPFYLVVLAAVTFLHIKESYCSNNNKLICDKK